MIQYTVLAGVIVVGLSMMVDAKGTVNLVTVIITTKGAIFILRKVIDTLDRDKGDIINFMGNCIAGGSALGILKNALMGVQPVLAVCGKIGDAIASLGKIADSILQLADKVTFWN